MIATDRLALISCHFCGKLFCDKDPISTISARLFNNYNMNFEELMVEDESNIHIPKEINFHESCFMEVAGKDYTP